MSARVYSRRLQVMIGIALGLSTLLLYLPALRHSFIEYDDQQYVTENPHVQAGLSWGGLVWAFGFHASNWHPLTWLSHMLDSQIYGAGAGGHHFTNVLLHAGSTLVLFLALNRLTGKMWRAAAVAALFAWHPLHVESVAWVAVRKDVLCGFFWMLTIYTYAGYAAKPSITKYLTTLILFALCLMAKPMAVTLPFVLLLLDFWSAVEEGTSEQEACRNGDSVVTARSWKRLILEKVPFFGLAAVGCVLTIKAQKEAIVSTGGLGVGERMGHALVAYWHYLFAAFLPRHLAVYYPYEEGFSKVKVALAGIGLLLITLLVVLSWRRRPYLAVGWFWFLGTLVPVIGLVQVGDQAWADRYTYLPLIGIFIAVVWGVGEIVRRQEVLAAVAAALSVAMLVATSVQLSYWKDTNTLFSHAYQLTRQNYMALTVMGSVLAKEGKLDAAVADFRMALKLKPGFPEAYFYLGNALEQQGKTEEAIADYKMALWYKPISEQTHIFLGMILGKQLKYDEAAAQYRAALEINGDSPVAHNNLARILHSQGKLDEAVVHYLAALAIDPKLALAQNNLGILLLQKGETTEGVRHLREAVRLKPDDAGSQYNLGLALNRQAAWSEAAELFRKTVTATSTDPKAHYAFATALFHLQRTREAMAQYAAALLLQTDYPEALDGLAWILSTDPNADFRNGPEAVKMAERACELTSRKDPEKLKTLAAAYAEVGRFDEAVKTIEAAQALAASDNRQPVAEECHKMLGQFQQSKPWRNG